ncbi:hypothetical protein MUK42_10873 [Musa troglodytarum]|uniref:DUF3741 domain-containing protein n=1 Tax=Musa troglodytarum TaxID=320322 RepID=A0A9E7JI80_9LILI|nr:hypothetical protein MUK42_10873 [Musa troglodytarum]
MGLPQCAVAPLMRNKGGTPLLNREEGKSKSVKLKLTESKHNMRHRHEFPHRRQMIFLRRSLPFVLAFSTGSPKGTGYSRIKFDSLRSSSNKHEHGSLVGEIRDDQVDSVMRSVKTLMEEEMSQHIQKKITSDNLQIEGHPKKSYKQRNKKLKSSDAHGINLAASSSLDGHQSDSMDLTGRSSLNFDLASFLIEFYGYAYQQKHADSDNKFDLLPALENISPKIYNHLSEPDGHVDQKISFFQKNLADVSQAIISQKLMVEKQLDGRWVVHPKEYMDALDILNSDKELLMQLLHDPNSLFLKHSQCFHSAQVGKPITLGSDEGLENVQLLGEEIDGSGKCKESDSNKLFHKQSRYNFFRKDKSKGTKPSKGSPNSEALNRIVVLKPSPARIPNSSIIITPCSSPQSHHVLQHEEHGERILSHFSLKEIKRRLRHIIGESRKARHVISMDGVLHRIPVRSNYTGASSKLINSESTVASLASSSSRDTKKLSETLSLDKRNDKKIDLEECQVNINSNISSSRSQFSIYEEARKHLAEMLGTGADSLPTTHASESLGRVLSLPRYNELCPASSRQRVQELIMSSEETGNPSLHQLEQEGATNILSLARENLEFSSFPVSMPSDDLKFHILNTELVDTSILELPCIGEDLNNKEILEAADAEGIVRSNHLDVPLESSRSEIIVATEICEESAATQGQGSSQETSLTMMQSKVPLSSLLKENLVAPESTTERQEQPSPVSVLETFLSEDATSPEPSAEEPYGIRVQHQHVNYEDCESYSKVTASPDVNDSFGDCLQDYQARFDYVKVLLEASDLTNKFSERWNMAAQLLEPSLFDEIGIFFCFLQDDPKLLFDCIKSL